MESLGVELFRKWFSWAKRQGVVLEVKDMMEDPQRLWNPEPERKRVNGSAVYHGRKRQLKKQISSLGNEFWTISEGQLKM